MSEPQSPITHSNTATCDDRKLALANWVSLVIKSHTKVELAAISNDAGFRRYFRFNTHQPLLAVDAPPQTEDTRQFVALARFLTNQGIKTPHINAVDEQQGFLLIEDFGDRLLYNELPDAGYESALNTLMSLQKAHDAPELIPRYDRALLRRELDIFREWFVGTLLDYAINADEAAMLDTLFTHLENAALNQPQTLVHRDFHSRNLILCQDSNLGVIDFQGALWGGVTYDLVSLLRDCYRRIPLAQVNNIALDYHRNATVAGLLPPVTTTQFLRWFDWIGLQRHIKVLGIFARLYLRDGKSNYLNDLPLVIRYTLEVAGQYAELTPFARWFAEKLLPLAQQQHWYSDYRSAGEPGAGTP